MTDPVALLERLVGVATHNPGGDEPALAALLADELRARAPDEVRLSPTPRRDGGPGARVLARWGAPRLLVNVHLDTVPPAPGWKGDPFVARREEGAIVGLGVADTKGAIAAVLAALDEEAPRDTAVLFSGDEEVGNSQLNAFLAQGGAQGLERAIVCEPTNLALGVRHRGIVALSARLSGPGGHSSRADALPSPVADLGRVAAAVQEWGRARLAAGPPGFRGMCTNVARLAGGVSFNMVPAEAELVLSVRPPPGTDTAGVREELLSLCRGLAPQARLEVTLENPSFETRDPDAFEPLLGRLPRTDLGFWTEAALLRRAGVDAVVCGPGDIAQAHGADERLAVDELHRAVRLFAGVFRATRGRGR